MDHQEIDDRLFLALSELRSVYSVFPWPPNIRNVSVVTEVMGGNGDIAAAAKAIDVMRQMCPELVFFWNLRSVSAAPLPALSPLSFLRPQGDLRKIIVNQPVSTQPKPDLLVLGPVATMNPDPLSFSDCPVFAFMEIGSPVSILSQTSRDECSRICSQKSPSQASVRQLHDMLFSCRGTSSLYTLPMGLRQGTGIFLDPDRIQAPLSRECCCPSYLLNIEDASLRSDILEAMGVLEDGCLPNYDQHSFAFGYAHLPASVSRFIDCVAIHETARSVTIVLNQHSWARKYSPDDFKKEFLGEDCLSLLQNKGYSNITLRCDGKAVLLKQAQNSRSLTIIIRPSFTPTDVKRMQLAAERMLLTGDNSIAEGFAAKGSLILYEAVFQTKERFLDQQIGLAHSMNVNLSKLLSLCGKNLNRLFTADEYREMETLLVDPGLGEATIQVCRHVIDHYSFAPTLEAALKRTLWLASVPELANIEADALGVEFPSKIAQLIQGPSSARLPLATPRAH